MPGISTRDLFTARGAYLAQCDAEMDPRDRLLLADGSVYDHHTNKDTYLKEGLTMK